MYFLNINHRKEKSMNFDKETPGRVADFARRRKLTALERDALMLVTGMTEHIFRATGGIGPLVSILSPQDNIILPPVNAVMLSLMQGDGEQTPELEEIIMRTPNVAAVLLTVLARQQPADAVDEEPQLISAPIPMLMALVGRGKKLDCMARLAGETELGPAGWVDLRKLQLPGMDAPDLLKTLLKHLRERRRQLCGVSFEGTGAEQPQADAPGRKQMWCIRKGD